VFAVMLLNGLKKPLTLLLQELLLLFITVLNVKPVQKNVPHQKFVKLTDLLVKIHQPQKLNVMMLP